MAAAIPTEIMFPWIVRWRAFQRDRSEGHAAQVTGALGPSRVSPAGNPGVGDDREQRRQVSQRHEQHRRD